MRREATRPHAERSLARTIHAGCNAPPRRRGRGRPRWSDQSPGAVAGLAKSGKNLLLTDCGTGILAEALQAAVRRADSLLIVTSASIDGAESAQATVEWLEAHGLADLVARSVTVINGVRPGRMSVDIDTVERYFAAHTREVVRLPWDPHVEQGGEIHLEQLSRGMRDSLLGLAATVADDFPRRAALNGAAGAAGGGYGPGMAAPRPLGPSVPTESS